MSTESDLITYEQKLKSYDILDQMEEIIQHPDIDDLGWIRSRLEECFTRLKKVLREK